MYNLLDSFKNLKQGNIKNIPMEHCYPLLRWNSGSIKDLHWCSEINKQFFWCDKEIMKGLLSLGLVDKQPFLRYPKSKAEEEKNFEKKKDWIKKYMGWSEQEFKRNINIIGFVDLQDMSKKLGLDKKECKLLGVEFNVKPKPKGLFNYSM